MNAFFHRLALRLGFRSPIDIPSRLYDGGSYPGLITAQTPKDQFLIGANRPALEEIVEKTNDWYGNPPERALSWKEFCAITYAEIGVKNGHIDPAYDHGAGEYGLLPLPSNHGDFTGRVNGRPAPNPHLLYTAPINVQEFFLYIASTRVHSFYGDTFRYAGIEGDTEKMSWLIGAIVHGYFYSGTYTDPSKKPSTNEILQGIADGRSYSDILQGSTYKQYHVLPSREENIRLGMALSEN